MRLRSTALAGLILAAVITAACAGSQTPGSQTPPPGQLTTVRMVTEWLVPDPLWVPFVTAVQKGYYKEAGLDVQIQLPPDNATTVKIVGTGKAEVGLSAITDVVFARKEGVPVISVANYSQTNNWGMFAQAGHPVDIGALKGKAVGVYNDSWTAAMLPVMLKSAGLTMDDVKQVAATSTTIVLLLKNKIDVATEVTNLGGVEYETSSGRKPEVLLAKDAGAPDTPIWVYISNQTWAQQNPDLVKKWLAATKKGTEYAIAHPEEAVGFFEKAYPDTASSHQYNLAAWEATIPLLQGQNGFFTQTDQQWTAFTQTLVAAQQLDKALPPSDYYTNAYIGA